MVPSTAPYNPSRPRWGGLFTAISTALGKIFGAARQILKSPQKGKKGTGFVKKKAGKGLPLEAQATQGVGRVAQDTVVRVLKATRWGIKKAWRGVRNFLKTTEWLRLYRGEFIRGFLRKHSPRTYKVWRWKTYVKAAWRSFTRGGAKQLATRALRATWQGIKTVGRAAWSGAKATLKVTWEAAAIFVRAAGTAIELTAAAIKTAVAAIPALSVGGVIGILGLAMFIGITAFSIFLQVESFKRWTGPGESRYLSLVKKVDKTDGAAAGDILTYTIEYQTKDTPVENIILEDRIHSHADHTIGGAVVKRERFIDRSYGDEGFYLTSSTAPASPQVENELTARGDVYDYHTVATFNLGSLSPEQKGVIVYEVKVHPDYDPDATGPIENRVTLTGSVQDEEGNTKEAKIIIDVAVNAAGRGAMAAYGRSLLSCLSLGSDRRYSVYNERSCAQCAERTLKRSMRKYSQVECVAFVRAAMECSNISVPFSGHAGDWFANYAGKLGFTVYANGTVTPQRGDIICMAGGPDSLGHIGIIIGATAENIEVGHANMPKKSQNIGIVGNRIESLDGFVTQGIIRVNY